MEKLDGAVYMQTVWFIRRYWDLQEEYQTIIDETPSSAGAHGSGISNPTAIKVERLEKVKADIDAIERALVIVPPDFRKGVLMSIIVRKPFPANGATRTYKKWKRRFIYQVAVQKKFI